MNITLKQVPKQLHKCLKERAARNRRSINMEALHILEHAPIEEPSDLKQVLAELREIRRHQKRPVSVAEICESIREGRE